MEIIIKKREEDRNIGAKNIAKVAFSRRRFHSHICTAATVRCAGPDAACAKCSFKICGVYEIPRYTAISLLLIFSTAIAAQTNYTTLQDAFSKSYAFESRGNFTDAITTLKSVYQEDSYEINLRLGWETYLAGLFTESSAYYQKAIKLKPYSIEAKIGSANPASALGNWDQVISEYNAILTIDPQNTIVNYRMGSIYYGRKDYSKAEKYLEKVVNLFPFDYDSMVLYAWTEYRLGKLREAQVLFNKVLLMRPKDASATEGLGLIK